MLCTLRLRRLDGGWLSGCSGGRSCPVAKIAAEGPERHRGKDFAVRLVSAKQSQLCCESHQQHAHSRPHQRCGMLCLRAYPPQHEWAWQGNPIMLDSTTARHAWHAEASTACQCCTSAAGSCTCPSPRSPSHYAAVRRQTEGGGFLHGGGRLELGTSRSKQCLPKSSSSGCPDCWVAP